MAGGIYLVGEDDELLEMTEAPYDSEAVLQELLAKYPNLLAGDQMNTGEPRRWLLVTREMGLPSDELTGGRWSVDHLFLDQDGIPTLIEVKRSENTEIRRTVVGQLLEYAANAVSYWPVERIMSELETRCREDGTDQEAALGRLLGSSTNLADYWDRVRTNLQAGRVRLVFVSDAIPRELRRIVEFLNSQMDPADVYALEIRQFSGGELKTLVPRVIGASERKEIQRQGRRSARWDEPRFMTEISRLHGPGAVAVAERVLQWTRDKGLREWWGRGAQNGSFIPVLEVNGKTYSILGMWTGGTIEVLLQYHANWTPFTDEHRREEIAQRINAIPGIAIPLDAINRRPSIRLADIANSGNVDKLLEVHDWIIQEFRNA